MSRMHRNDSEFRRRTRFQFGCHGNGFNLFRIQLLNFAPCQPAWHRHRSESCTDQPAHLQILRLPEPSNHSVATFLQRHSKPLICRVAVSLGDDLLELRWPIFQLYASPLTRTAYWRSNSPEGCMSALASSPSFVNNSNPKVLISNRPTAIQRP